MQVLGVFGFEVLDEGLFSLPAELRRAPVGLALKALLTFLLVFLGVLVHALKFRGELARTSEVF